MQCSQPIVRYHKHMCLDPNIQNFRVLCVQPRGRCLLNISSTPSTVQTVQAASYYQNSRPYFPIRHVIFIATGYTTSSPQKRLMLSASLPSRELPSQNSAERLRPQLALERQKDLGLPRGSITVDDLRGDERDMQGINWIELRGRIVFQELFTRLQSYANLVRRLRP